MDAQRSVVRHQTPSGWGTPTWWIVAGRELTDLWVGKGPIILVLYSVLLGGVSYVFYSNVQAGVFTPKELIWMLLQVAYNAGAIIGIGLGADCFSGERDRETLEGLLLTPASRTQIAVGKFLAAFSVWPACLAIAVPYFVLLTPDRQVFTLTLLWGGVCGSALAAGMVGLGMIVSALSNSNRVSMSASLGIYLVMLAPSQFTGAGQKGDVAKIVQWVDPIAAVDEFTEKLIVNMRTLHEVQTYLEPILGFAVLVLALLFIVVGPRLRLDGQLSLRWRWRRRVVSAAAGLVVLLAALPTLPAHAAAPAAAQPPLEVSIDTEYKQATAGEQDRVRDGGDEPGDRDGVQHGSGAEHPQPLQGGDDRPRGLVAGADPVHRGDRAGPVRPAEVDRLRRVPRQVPRVRDRRPEACRTAGDRPSGRQQRHQPDDPDRHQREPRGHAPRGARDDRRTVAGRVRPPLDPAPAHRGRQSPVKSTGQRRSP